MNIRNFFNQNTYVVSYGTSITIFHLLLIDTSKSCTGLTYQVLTYIRTYSIILMIVEVPYVKYSLLPDLCGPVTILFVETNVSYSTVSYRIKTRQIYALLYIIKSSIQNNRHFRLISRKINQKDDNQHFLFFLNIFIYVRTSTVLSDPWFKFYEHKILLVILSNQDQKTASFTVAIFYDDIIIMYGKKF